MKRNILKWGMLVLALALSVIVTGCGSSPSSTGSSTRSGTAVTNVPDIDYSRIGPNDSVIIVYIDPSLVIKVDPKNTSAMMASINDMVNLQVTDDTTKFSTPIMVGIVYTQSLYGMTLPSYVQSCQVQIPNGTHTLYVKSWKGTGSPSSDVLPFEAAFDNDAITYKIRLATNEEKRAGGIGLGNEVFTLEEVAQKKLR